MAIAEVFPYSDQHNLNLDWIITKIKEFSGNQISAIACQQIAADTIKFVITYTDGTTKELTEITLPAGPQGVQGDPGPQGVPGEDGADGAAATIAIGTVSTLSPGSDATVTNSGTSSAAVFNFGIPQGATGNPGEIIEQIVPVEATTTASRAYTTGDYFVNNLGVLVEATSNIALGATIDSTNSTAVNQTLADELADVNSAIKNWSTDVKGNSTDIDLTNFHMDKNTYLNAVQINGFANSVSLNAGYKIFTDFIATAGRPNRDTAISVFSTSGILNGYISSSGSLVIYSPTALTNVSVTISCVYFKY